MQGLGYVESRDFALDTRFAGGDPTQYARIVSEVVGTKPDVIVATGSPLYPLFKTATRSTPIVVTVSPDPVVQGIAESLARPGGNFTGLTTSAADTTLKHIELLKALRPKLSRYALLSNPTGGQHPQQVASHQEAAKKIGLALVAVSAGDPAGIGRAFGEIKAGRAEGVIVLGDTFFLQQRTQIVTLAQEQGLPSVFNVREFTEAGGLVSYGVDVPHNTRRAADFVHRILRGAKPAELPFEQPSKFELVINARTARMLGISVPRAVLFSADRVIE
jgi:putative ABC transport system substrate-binding protein